MLISCLMATADRRPFIPTALACWLAQTHPNRQLLILDDGDDDIHDLIPPDPRIVYTRVAAAHATLGAKINALTSAASGPICCNWDDDDWYAPTRLEHQLAALLESGKSLTGFHTINYWDARHKIAYLCHSTLNPQTPCGASQMWVTHWLVKHPAPHITLPVDREMNREAARYCQLHAEDGRALFVARYHQTNCWRTPLEKRGYRRISAASLPPGFLQAMGEK